MAHTEETIKKWKQEFSWLLFITAQKLVSACAPLKKKSLMIYLLLEAQIINYQACKII